ERVDEEDAEVVRPAHRPVREIVPARRQHLPERHGRKDGDKGAEPDRDFAGQQLRGSLRSCSVRQQCGAGGNHRPGCRGPAANKFSRSRRGPLRPRGCPPRHTAGAFRKTVLPLPAWIAAPAAGIMESDIHRPEADMQLKAVHPDAYVFPEPHRKLPGLTRLAIACHGIGGRQIATDSTAVSPEELAPGIRTWTAADGLHAVRLLACHSASLAPGASRRRRQTTDPARLWSTACGARLSAALPGVKVRSYVGEVTATCEHDLIWQAYRMMGPT